MNKPGDITAQARRVLDRALDAVRETPGLSARVVHRRSTAGKGHAVLEVRTPDRKAYRFIAEIKTVDRFQTPSQVKSQLAGLDEPPLLVAPYISRETAKRCRELQLAFMDTAGNAYLEHPGLFVWVAGQQRPAELKQTRFRALNPAGLRITFSLLCQPNLITANYREIARVANVALGSVGPAMKDLQVRGFIRRAGRGTPRLLDPRRLLEEWVTHYHTTLRAKLNPRRFDAIANSLETAHLAKHKAYWGGEVAADKLTGMLKPAAFTIYAREPIAKLVAATRLRARPDGQVEVLDVFWNFPPDPDRPDIAPPVLVYADLLGTQDGRNIEAAKLIYDEFIEHTFSAAD